ncbi:MAG TPA: flagellar basal body P-ring protein FlgI [Candidatus Krumholzibacteria bacterium]|nr:flagellar basal body P-ring protein FlgI [Candidatus Krumholzibacteria bacterium]
MPTATHRIACFAAAAAVLACAAPAGASGTERIKDLALLEGTAPEALVGQGLVLGLNGTGDNASSDLTANALANLMEKLNITVDPAQLKAKNVAIVTVTAAVDPNAAVGSRIDVTVTSSHDASSLEGGVLVMTPLLAVDGTPKVLAQGSVSIGGFNIKAGAGNSFRKNHAQVGTIPNGGVVKAPLGGRFMIDGKVAWLLNNPDFATAANVAGAINRSFGGGIAVARGAQRIEVAVPGEWREDPVSFIARMGEVEARHDAVARVVVNERTGTIIVGQDVHLREAAVAHGTLKVVVNTYYNVSQPNAFSKRGDTVVTPEVNADVQDHEAQVLHVPETSTVADVVGVLNDIGASPRDIIAILEALKRSGSLQAELILM